MRLLVHRTLRLVPLLFVVSLATFLMVELVPGDPARAVLGADASSDQIAAMRARLGLDQPFAERYVRWLGRVLQGDLGRSLRPQEGAVTSMIASKLPVTLEVALLAMGMALVLAVPAGVVAAYRPRDRFDQVSSSVSFAFISTPSFLAALLLIFSFVFHIDGVRTSVALLAVAAGVLQAWATVRAVRAGASGGVPRTVATGAAGVVVAVVVATVVAPRIPAFPRQGFVRLTADEGVWANIRHAFLPALTLAITEAAVFFRLLRNDMIATLKEDFVLAARAKGMPAWHVLVRDALRPSSFSLITVAGVSTGRLLGGTAIVETIFNLPGMGTMVVDSIGAKDFPAIQGAVLVLAVVYVVLNTVVDVSYAFLDPRVRRG